MVNYTTRKLGYRFHAGRTAGLLIAIGSTIFMFGVISWLISLLLSLLQRLF